MNIHPILVIFYVAGFFNLSLIFLTLPFVSWRRDRGLYWFLVSSVSYGVGTIVFANSIRISADNQILNLSDTPTILGQLTRLFSFLMLTIFIRSFASHTFYKISPIKLFTILFSVCIPLLYLGSQYLPDYLRGIIPNILTIFFIFWIRYELTIIKALDGFSNNYPSKLFFMLLWFLLTLCGMGILFSFLLHLGISGVRIGVLIKFEVFDLIVRLVRTLITPAAYLLAFVLWAQNYSTIALKARAHASRTKGLLIKQSELIKHLSNVNTAVDSGALSLGIAHELNQYLTSIEINSEMLLIQLGGSSVNLEKIQLNIGNILDANRSAANLVTNFKNLFYKQMEPMRASNPDQLCQDIVSLYSNRALKSSVEIRLNLRAEASCMVWESLLRQVFSNLIRNAIDALDGVDKVDKCIHIQSTVDQDGRYELTIRDNGPGVKPDQVNKLFNLFATSKTSGSGIGLWLSYEIVKRHHGTISFFNLPKNGGVIFVVSIPQCSTLSFD